MFDFCLDNEKSAILIKFNKLSFFVTEPQVVSVSLPVKFTGKSGPIFFLCELSFKVNL
jgi:hypothetical protein